MQVRCQVLGFSAELTSPASVSSSALLISHISPSQDKLRGDLGHLPWS